ncbi:MAG: sensor histidine kinase [Chloroflexi bacterium]|nr:MAG: sensor histidine kinase [Chloroflexota bacterium]
MAALDRSKGYWQKKDKTSWRIRIAAWVLQYRWLVILFISMLSLTFEIIEHIFTVQHAIDSHFYREIFTFGVVFPVLFGLLFDLLAETETERNRLASRQDVEHLLNLQLGMAHNWEDLSRLLARLPRQVVSELVGVCGYVYDVENEVLETAVVWYKPYVTISTQPPILDKYQRIYLLKKPILQKVTPKHYAQYIIPENCNIYCLPLTRSGQLVAILHLFLPDQLTISSEQAEILNNLAPALALAIDSLHPKGTGIIRAAATEAERRRLARYLHDTLGQNLGLLCLKLDQLQGNDVLNEVAAIREELAQMYNVANQAYEQVRQTLTQLKPVFHENLPAALRQEAEQFEQHWQLPINLAVRGELNIIPHDTQEKIMGIVHEALLNIGKHAHAHKVSLEVEQLGDMLTITIEDDGIGFDPFGDEPAGHYGLLIMKERAKEINGRLHIQSTPGQGTIVVLSLPIPAPVLTPI